MKEQFCNDVEIAMADIPISTWKKINVECSGNMRVPEQNQVRMYICSVLSGLHVLYGVWCVVHMRTYMLCSVFCVVCAVCTR